MEKRNFVRRAGERRKRQASDQRRKERKECLIPAGVRASGYGSSPFASAGCLNLSGSGLQLITELALATGEMVEIRLGTPHSEHHAFVRGRVVRSLPSKTRGVWWVGIQVVSVPERFRSIFLSYSSDTMTQEGLDKVA